MGRIYMALAGVAALVALIAGIYFAGANHQRKHDAPIIASWQAATADYKRASEGWADSFHKAERLRHEEALTAIGAVNSANASCDARVAAVRASERALKGLLSRPVKVDGKGCPVPAIWTAKDLAPVLRPEVK